MAPGNTTTGAVLEQMVLPALDRGGFTYRKQARIGLRPGGRRHVVDVLATDGEGRNYLISLKWQQVSGTTEQKVPFEAMCLAEAIRTCDGEYDKAYLVLGGDGWTLRDFYVSGGLNDHLVHGELVHVMTLESFIAAANQGKL